MSQAIYWLVNLADVDADIKANPVTKQTQGELKKVVLILPSKVPANAAEQAVQRANYAKTKWRNVPEDGKIEPRISDDDTLMIIMSEAKPSPTSQGPFTEEEMDVIIAAGNWVGEAL